MSSHKTDTFSLRVRRSPLFLYGCLLICVIGVISVALSGINLSWKFSLAVILLYWLMLQLRKHYWMNHRSSIAAVALDTNGWRIRSPDTIKWHHARLLPCGWVQSWVIVLSFETDVAPYRRTLILLKGSASDLIFHRLRIVLRTSAYQITTIPHHGIEGVMARNGYKAKSFLRLKRRSGSR